MSKNTEKIPELEFSAGLRWTHWIRAFAIAFLTISGFYIAYVFVYPNVANDQKFLLNGVWRAWHEIIGFILIACLIYKTYLFFFDKLSKKERVSIYDFFSPKCWIAQIKYYLFIGKHPHLKGVYNPLQFASYLFFYIVLFVICLTGLVLYAHVYHAGLGGFIYEPMRWCEAMMGGLANVREIHHIAMWIILIFVAAHVYMAILNAVKQKNGGIDAIITGYKFIDNKEK